MLYFLRLSICLSFFSLLCISCNKDGIEENFSNSEKIDILLNEIADLIDVTSVDGDLNETNIIKVTEMYLSNLESNNTNVYNEILKISEELAILHELEKENNPDFSLEHALERNFGFPSVNLKKDTDCYDAWATRYGIATTTYFSCMAITASTGNAPGMGVCMAAYGAAALIITNAYETCMDQYNIE